jgi:hypothetical protein
MKLIQTYYLSIGKRELELDDDEVVIRNISPTYSSQDTYKYSDLEQKPMSIRSSNSAIKTISFTVLMLSFVSSMLKLPFALTLSFFFASGLIYLVYVLYKNNFLFFSLKSNRQQGFFVRLSRNQNEDERKFLADLYEKIK